MPKHEIHHEAGNFVPEEVAELMRRYFSPREIEKLERLGGLVTIKVTTPFKPKEQRKKEPVKIDAELVEPIAADFRSYLFHVVPPVN